MASRKQTAALWALLIATATSQLLLPLSRQGLDSQIAERASTEQTWLDNPRYGYMINVTVGTPGQPVALAMSVSSPHTWVPDAGAQFCLEAGLPDSSYPARCGWGTCKSPRSMLQIQTDSWPQTILPSQRPTPKSMKRMPDSSFRTPMGASWRAPTSPIVWRLMA